MDNIFFLEIAIVFFDCQNFFFMNAALSLQGLKFIIHHQTH